MGLRPAVSVPQVSPAEMELLIARTGLVLNPGQIADLVLAWRQIVTLTALIPRDRPMADDQAFVFHLPPLRPATKRRSSRKPNPSGKSNPTKPRVRAPTTKRTPARKAARKTAPKRR